MIKNLQSKCGFFRLTFVGALVIALLAGCAPSARYNYSPPLPHSYVSQGLKRDAGLSRGVTRYREAAEQGDAQAQNNLGFMYETGQGVSRDYQEAAKWYRKAAEQGHAMAQLSLGEMYHEGRGVPRDDQEAVKWFRKAAKQGNAPAQSYLKNMGEAVPLGQAVGQDDAVAKPNLAPDTAQSQKSGNTGKKRKSPGKSKQVVDTERMAKSKKQPADQLTQEDKEFDAIFSTGNKKIRGEQEAAP
jgi:hypothetical protein